MAIGANLIIGNPATFGGRAQAQPGRLRGTVGIEVDPQANFHVSTPVYLAGTVTTSMRYSGELAERLRLVGTLDTGIDLEGAARIAHNIEGELPVNVPTQGHIFPPITMRGTLGIGVISEADATVIRALRGAVPVAVTPEASLPEIVSLAGTLDLGVTVTGELANHVTLAGTVGAGVNLEGNLDVSPLPATLEGLAIADGWDALYDPTTAESPADAIISAMDVPPTPERAQLIRDTVDALIDARVWDKLDALWVMATHSYQAARINWKSPGYGDIRDIPQAIDYVVDVGIRSTGLTVIDYELSFEPSKYTLTSAHIALYVAETGGRIANAMESPVSNNTRLHGNAGITSIAGRNNSSSVVTTTLSSATDAGGVWQVIRVGNDVTLVKNRAPVDSISGDTPTIGVPTRIMGPLHSAYTHAASFGGALSNEERNALDTILKNYLAGL